MNQIKNEVVLVASAIKLSFFNSNRFDIWFWMNYANSWTNYTNNLKSQHLRNKKKSEVKN